jgi:hypothetical protein
MRALCVYRNARYTTSCFHYVPTHCCRGDNERALQITDSTPTTATTDCDTTVNTIYQCCLLLVILILLLLLLIMILIVLLLLALLIMILIVLLLLALLIMILIVVLLLLLLTCDCDNKGLYWINTVTGEPGHVACSSS